MGYVHLSIDERESILKMQSKGNNLSEIASYLGRNKGTLSRELSRNTSSTGEYKPHLAQRYYDKRRADSKQPYRLEDNGRLCRRVCTKLKLYHSPEQISGRLEKDYPCAPDMRVSPLTVYSWVKRDGCSLNSMYIRASLCKPRIVASGPWLASMNAGLKRNLLRHLSTLSRKYTFAA